jgi:hypothetical protein
VGSPLLGFEERGPWSDSLQIYAWIRDPFKFMQKNDYTSSLKKKYGTMMQAFPGMSKDEIDAIREYVKSNEQGIIISY